MLKAKEMSTMKIAIFSCLSVFTISYSINEVYDLTSVNFAGNTILHTAVLEEDIKKVDQLTNYIKKYTDSKVIDAQNLNGMTPIRLAHLRYTQTSNNKFLQIYNILHSRGANPNIKDIMGNSAIFNQLEEKEDN